MFEQLLGVSPIGRRDNFFDLGGHSILAARLVTGLQDFSAISLGIGVIFQRATVAGIAEAIRDGGVLDTPWVMPLNRDSARNDLPVFCICGIQLYKELAQAIGDEHPVLGVFLPAEEHAIVRAQTTGEVLSVESLADGYLEAIRAKQPHGPYSLIGASFGGVLAYVMAQKLEAAGEKVALLVLIDTTLPRAVHRNPWRWLVAHARGLLDEGPSYATERFARTLERARHYLPLASGHRPSLLVPPTISARVAAYRAATTSYDPQLRPYAGAAMVFCATDRNEFESDIVDPHLGWGSLVRALEVHQTQGTHLSMLRLPHVKELAAPLRERLARARFEHAADAELQRKTTNGTILHR